MAPDLLDSLKQLIAQSSISSTRPELNQGNLTVISLLANWFESLGFQCEIMPIPGAADKANLLATLGSGPGGLVLAGHTDTVPCDDSLWQSDPLKLREDNNRLYGLGICDMKGFFGLVLDAVRDLKPESITQPLIILATADEETSMAGARELVKQGRPQARYALIGEPTGLQPLNMHKGIMMERLKLTGQSGHSSDPDRGRNAMDAMHAVISEIMLFRSELKQQWNNPGFSVPVPTLNLGCIHGGDNPNRICEQCTLEFDVRMLPGMDSDDIRAQIRARALPVAENLGVSMTLGPINTTIEPFSTDLSSPLVQLCETLTGYSATSAAFATEAPFLSKMGMETVVLGPGDIAQAHQPDEYLGMERIEPMIKVLRQLINNYCLTK